MRRRFMPPWFRRKQIEEPETSERSFGLAKVFQYAQLKKATDNFTTELGEGGYGSVYLGTLGDGQTVAVKALFDRKSLKTREQFVNELMVLSRLRHKNLVSLVGCTDATDPSSQELLLVYEYVPNGTVADHIHGQRSFLNWADRIQIAVEIADALAYLHGLEPPVIHRDVKTSNILLDEALHAKVADFGICRQLPFNATHASTVLQGTVGYRDPEYDLSFKLSVKSDVYSFGVVLMELVTGLPAIDVDRDIEDVYLYEMSANKIINKRLEDFVHPKLCYLSNIDHKRMIDSTVELAGRCLQQLGAMRPPMSQVLAELKQIQNNTQPMGLNADPPQELDACTFNGLDKELAGSPRKVLLAEIPFSELMLLTSNFDPKALIGESSMGRVYYATLSDGQPAAIKKLDHRPKTDFAAQLKQVLAVSQLEHEYLVQLLGYCFETDNQILVYEFASKGSLHDILHGRKGVTGAKPDLVLSWNQRVKIAYGAARGLEHLHETVQPPIVHQHLVSSNILLFDDYNPKIADCNFTYKPPEPELEGRTYSSHNAPEFYKDGKVTQESNIYSFGVILLELLTGRKPVDDTLPSGEQNLVHWTRNMGIDRIEQCVDHKLNGDYPPIAVARMANVAAHCVNYNMDMTSIVSVLQSLLNS